MSKHVPQRQLGFPSDDAFAPAGSFARAALWPRPHASSCHAPHHTLWLRARDADGDGDGAGAVAAPAGPAFVQVLVARGSATLPLMEMRAGDFFSGVIDEADLYGAAHSPDALLLVKRRPAHLGAADGDKARRVQNGKARWGFTHEDAAADDRFASATLVGNPFVDGELGWTSLVRFPLGSVVSSHVHPAGIFHEIVYLQGGHRTPDGFYAPGHHVTSAPLCKEGPWLAADDDGPLPEGWPRFDGGAPYRSPAPFAPPFADIPDAVGILFVHRGPFVLGDGAINWQKLAPLDLGPAG